MAAEFTDNLIEFLEDKLTEFNPDIATGEGTSIRDLFIKPFSVIFQPIVDEILRIRQNLSLEAGESLSEEDLDKLAANFFVTRKPGSKSTGVARLFFSLPVDELVPQGTVFIASNGIRFLSTADVTITSSGLQLNTFGDLFFQDVNVEAENTGVSGNIPASLLADIQASNTSITDITNPAAFTGGSETETNAELMTRLAIAITFRNLINDNGAKLILLEAFPRLIDILVVGFGRTHQIFGENIGVGTGALTVFQLSENEDIIASSVDVYAEVLDETVAAAVVAAGPYPLDFSPIDPDTLILSRTSAFTGADVLTLTTHYTIVAGTGVVTITAAGAAFLAGFNLHARYKSDKLAASFYTADFFGVVTFTAPPPAGVILTADFAYYLMRRDRMSGTGITLGDDTFGTFTNVHIGGKVDYYLKFSGLESVEFRLNGLEDENFLFAQATTDPSPTGIQQYVPAIALPIVYVTNIEKIDPGTNLPSGTFLQSGVDYDLVIMPNKLNLNMSMRQRVRLDIINPIFVGTDVVIRYLTHQDFTAVQAFVDDPVNRIVTADLIARAPMPAFVDVDISYSRPTGGPDVDTLRQSVVDYINGLKLGKCLTVYGLSNALVAAGAKFVVLPLVLNALRVNLDFTTMALTSSNEIELPPNFQFIARTINVTEVSFEDCSSL